MKGFFYVRRAAWKIDELLPVREYQRTDESHLIILDSIRLAKNYPILHESIFRNGENNYQITVAPI